MKRLQLSILAASVLVSVAAAAAPIGDATFLRKLSLSLRGVPPDPDEYTALKSTRSGAERQTFLQTKIKTYLASPEHRDRLVFQLSERFQIKPPGVPRLTFETAIKNADYETKRAYQRDAATDLFERLTTENLSWDRLLTQKSYTLIPPTDSYSQVSDFGFMALLKTVPLAVGAIGDDYVSRPMPSTDPLPLAFDDDDPRIAGVVTTSRFSGRYTTTGINKNRRRAAAIFRTFLCDSMVPSISSNSDRTHEFNNVAFAEKFQVTENEIKAGVTASANARHGSDPQCAACHYKLDPLGRAFQAMGVSLLPQPSPGALVFKHADGSLVDIPLRGLGDLGKAVVQQPEYVDCQTSWFWSEFIGKDVRLTSKLKAELGAAFDNVGRRTNDFISYLVNRPEFREKPAETSAFVTFDRVQPLLKRCDSCHAHLDDVPSFAKLPIGFNGDQQEHTSWIAEMTDRLNRADGVKGRMPKNPEMWAQGEIELLKSWLAQGARNEQGEPTVPAASQGAKP